MVVSSLVADSFESAMHSMALLLLGAAASASAGAPTTGHRTQHPSLDQPPPPRVLSLTLPAAQSHSVHGGRLPNPRLTAGRRGVVPGGAANRTHNLRGPLPRLLPPRRLIPALFCIVTRALGASSIPAPWQMPSSRPTSSSTSPTTKLCAASSDSSTSTRSPSTGPRLFRGEMIPTSATWMMTLARTPCSH